MTTEEIITDPMIGKIITDKETGDIAIDKTIGEITIGKTIEGTIETGKLLLEMTPNEDIKLEARVERVQEITKMTILEVEIEVETSQTEN